jgi:hypothetical protein
MKIPRSLNGRWDASDLRSIASNILGDNSSFLEAIDNIYRGLKYAGLVNVTITEYVRWCTTARELLMRGTLSPQFAAGIGALRTIADALPDGDRR